MDVVIVTGASKGIGHELREQLQAAGKRVIGIARTVPQDATNFVPADLAKTNLLEGILTSIIDENSETATSFTLINNAGIVDPIGLVGNLNAVEIEKSIAVNLTAPIILSNTFIEKLRDVQVPKRILNISSGAGRNPYEGWGAYCTTKAGLDHFSRVVAMEQANEQYPVEIVSIAPGIIDTDMQRTIRSSDEGAFPLLDQFITYKEQGILSSAKETAEKLFAVLEHADFKSIGPIADVRKL
ncbi:SDR family NAD(P)-dependent oxidoreductase [Sporosarcina sp. Marseille-Q4063]|uniref:SDR family NAD(P)-dependent oxidoreductase n=1 Tax=Sporosarcina sp. Marseille-Q4063 TaxID=2810514 RepID=UPI001BAEF3A6|nr:SDR family NAD(P)-dependent oxidoreductase [Sporosarcina sp. Marseille-Q4063]QUW22763.1 SDR family NAD(P)-dependent oxidoreductase [Sporosarcina sp. Marseille-Q4063]